jgi:hypothetical protein
MPVTPECSLTDPTLAIHPAATFGAPFRTTIKTFMPLSSMTSCTGTCCAQTQGRREKISRVVRVIKMQLPAFSILDHEPRQRKSNLVFLSRELVRFLLSDHMIKDLAMESGVQIRE